MEVEKPPVVKEEDLEEGELTSSSDSDEGGVGDQKNKKGSNSEALSPPHLVEDYELLERPISMQLLQQQGPPPVAGLGLGRSGITNNDAMRMMESRPIARPSRPPPTLGGRPMTTMFKPLKDFDSDYDEEEGEQRPGRKNQVLLRSSSDDDTDDDDEEDDSDEDLAAGKRRRCIPTGPAPWIGGGGGASTSGGGTTEQDMMPMEHNDAFKNQAEAFQQKRKVNNCWGQLLQDEMVSNVFGGVGVQEADLKTVNVDRGPESYSFQFKQNLIKKFGIARSDSSDVSSPGLTDNELEAIKSLELASKKEHLKRSASKDGEVDLRNKLNSRKRKYQAQKSKDRHNQHVKFKLRKRLLKMSHDVLAKYMSTKLDEPKTKLIERGLNLLGKKKCVSLFLKTMKILRRGGLMIKNQERYRTPGGVYFYLMRGDPRLPFKVVNKVFETEHEKIKFNKKKKASKKRLERKKRLEKLETESFQKKPGNNADTSTSVSRSTSARSSSTDVSKMDEDQQQANAATPAGVDSDVDSDEYYGLRIDETRCDQEQVDEQPM